MLLTKACCNIHAEVFCGARCVRSEGYRGVGYHSSAEAACGAVFELRDDGQVAVTGAWMVFWALSFSLYYFFFS